MSKLTELEKSIKRIKATNDPEFMKMVELYRYINSPDVIEEVGTGKYNFTLGYGDKIIEFYDLAQTWNDFNELVENSILEY